MYTSSLPGCGCSGNVFVDLQGDKGERGVLTLRNKGGSFRPVQVSVWGGHVGCRGRGKPWCCAGQTEAEHLASSGCLGFDMSAYLHLNLCCALPHRIHAGRRVQLLPAGIGLPDAAACGARWAQGLAPGAAGGGGHGVGHHPLLPLRQGEEGGAVGTCVGAVLGQRGMWDAQQCMGSGLLSAA